MTVGTMGFAVEGQVDCCRAPVRAAGPPIRFIAACAALFVASAAGTVIWGRSMGGTHMPMPGGWTMSMAWMRMPDQSWAGAAASFVGMWTVMMVAMMTPALVPMLWRYRQAAGRDRNHLRARTVLVGAGYFLVWAAQGAVVFPLGVAAAAATMRWPSLSRDVPLVMGLIVLAAGVMQATPWKGRHLTCCRALRPTGPHAGSWRYGLRLGLHCSACCVGLTVVLLVVGVMDLAVMAGVTAAITIERLAPGGVLAAHAVGAALVAAGLFLLVRVICAG